MLMISFFDPNPEDHCTFTWQLVNMHMATAFSNSFRAAFTRIMSPRLRGFHQQWAPSQYFLKRDFRARKYFWTDWLWLTDMQNITKPSYKTTGNLRFCEARHLTWWFCMMIVHPEKVMVHQFLQVAAGCAGPAWPHQQWPGIPATPCWSWDLNEDALQLGYIMIYPHKISQLLTNQYKTTYLWRVLAMALQGKSSFCLQPLPPLTASESDPGLRPQRSVWLMTGFCCLFLLANTGKLYENVFFDTTQP